MSVSKCICCHMASAPFCSPAAFGYFFFLLKKMLKPLKLSLFQPCLAVTCCIQEFLSCPLYYLVPINKKSSARRSLRGFSDMSLLHIFLWLPSPGANTQPWKALGRSRVLRNTLKIVFHFTLIS